MAIAPFGVLRPAWKTMSPRLRVHRAVQVFAIRVSVCEFCQLSIRSLARGAVYQDSIVADLSRIARVIIG